MQIVFAILLFMSVVPIGVQLRRARQERRAVRVFDDVVGHLALPLMILSFMAKLPPVAERVVVAVIIIIAIGAIGRLIHWYRTRGSE